MQIFYNSSMPRAGSTLLSNIIGQNPDFYVTPTNGLLELIFAARMNYTSMPEFKAQDPELMKQAFLSFCREGMKGYYTPLTDKKYVLDKSRGWGIHYNLLNMINPDPKIICIVRDLRDIISSMEKLYRKNPDKHNTMVNHAEMKGTTLFKRVNIWLNSQPVGLALERMNEIFLQGINRHMYFIKYEDLLTNPNDVMKGIYNYLGVDYYQHDFNKIEQITKEDDEVYGIYGNHTIQNSLTPLKQEHIHILGPDICNYIVEKHQWYFNIFYNLGEKTRV